MFRPTSRFSIENSKRLEPKRSYLDHCEKTGTGETGSARELFCRVEFIFIILLGDGGIIGKDRAVVEALKDLTVCTRNRRRKGEYDGNTHGGGKRLEKKKREY